MKTDLRNLATSEEGYAANNAGAYVAQASVTQAAPLVAAGNYTPSAGITVVVTKTGAGRAATATHTSVSGKTCAIFVNQTAVAPATYEGEPKCN